MFLTGLMLILAACGQQVAELPTEAVIPTLTPSLTPLPTETPLTPTETATPTPTATTAPPTETSIPTDTVVPTDTPDLVASSVPITQAAQTREARNTRAANNVFLQQTAAAILQTQSAEGGQADVPAEPTTEVRAIEPTTLFVQSPARVRECARLDNEACPTLAEVITGTAVTATGEVTGDVFRESDQWYQLDYGGREAYVHGTLVGTEPADTRARNGHHREQHPRPCTDEHAIWHKPTWR